MHFNEDTVLRRGHLADAGVDIFTRRDIILEPHTTQKVPLGFGVAIPYNFVGFLKPRTSVAASGVHLAECPIDPGYEGEIFAVFTNTTDNTITIPANKASCQLVVQPFVSLELIDSEFWIDFKGAKRKTGAFGSTDETQKA
jgi:dUTP pyrophosphatase